MILDKVIEEWGKVDKCYMDVYTTAEDFNGKTTAQNKQALERALKAFKKQFQRYENDLKNLWISEKWEG